MGKLDKIEFILQSIREQIEELVLSNITEHMSAEEIVVLASEIVLSEPISTIDYTQPVGQVDRGNVSIMLDDVTEFTIYSTEYEDEDY